MTAETLNTRKTVSIMIPCYNEEENVLQITHAVVQQMEMLPQYDYEVLLIDNCSRDNTRALIRQVCAENPRVKAILNVKNFGQFNSPYYGLCQTTGDCAISICADFQDPVEMIPRFLEYWEQGYEIVCGVKTSSQENRCMYLIRTIYYKLLKRYSNVEQIEHFTGFGLYDRKFIEVMRSLDDSQPFLRGIVAELGGRRIEVPYEQPLRRAGKTHNNFRSLFDAAMLSMTSYTKATWRILELIGSAGIVATVMFLVYNIVRKCLFWDEYHAGIAPIIVFAGILCSAFLIISALLGEYITSVNQRIMHRPLVVEEERINFGSDAPKPMGIFASMEKMEQTFDAKKRVEAAKSLLALGSDIEIISAATGLTREELQILRKM